MARILFGSAPVSGHVRPGLPIARALVERGHDVVWCTGSRFRDAVERTGARFVPFVEGKDFDEADLDASFPGRAGLTGVRQLQFDFVQLFIDTTPGALADLRAVAGDAPVDAVVFDSSFIAGAFLAEERGLPSAVYGITPLTARSADVAPTGLGLLPRDGVLGRLRNTTLNLLVEHVVFAGAQKRFSAVRAELGLPRSSTFFLDHTLAHTPLFLQGTIAEFEYPRRDLPPNVHLVGALLPEPPGGTSLPAWWPELEGARPVVLVTQGTVKVEPGLLLEPALAALADEDVLVVGTTGGHDPAAVLQRSPAANARLEPFIPFADLLPHIDVVVTNGGYGGTQQALAHGVPVVAAGVTEAKNEVAARVGWSGAGLDLRTETPTPEAIRAAVRTVLTDPSYRRRAGELQAAYAACDAPGTAARLVESLLPASGPG